jgi:hypothetical protein
MYLIILISHNDNEKSKATKTILQREMDELQTEIMKIADQESFFVTKHARKSWHFCIRKL